MTHASRLSGGEIGLMRFIATTRDELESFVILAEDGPLAPALREAGATVEVLPMDEQTRGLRREEIARPGAHQLRAAAGSARYVATLRRRLRELRPDIVHAISLKSGPYGGAAARAAGVPMVWHLHDHLVPSYLAPGLIRAVQAAIATLPSGLLVPSRSVLATTGRRRRGLVVDVMPFPVPLPERRAPVRDEVRTVGMLGRITPWKGQDVFLRAFADAYAGTEVRARIIGNAMFGETDFEEHLHVLAAELGIADRVEFRGFREDVYAELDELDVVVHASTSPDPLPGVVIEAMGAGLPVVAANAGGNPEHVTDGVNGFLHTPGDPASLASALRTASADRARREAIGTAARESARRYAPETINPRMLGFYARVLGRAP